MELKVQNYISAHQLLRDKQKVLIALSGGADSVCLLLMMQRLGYECHAVHCNFHLRGEESDRDEAFVIELCRHQDVPLHITHFDTHAYASSNGISIEMAARDLRYAYFEEVAGEVGAKAICVGHHRDDNAETFLLNAVRGTGIKGLCGIKEVRSLGNVRIVRPLLNLTRSDILAYLKGRDQDYVTDSTNLVADVGRNKIRLDVVPVLKSINPSAVDNITTSIENLKEVQKVYEAAIRADIERCEHAEGQMSIAELLSCVSPISVLHEWLKGKGFNRAQECGILESARSGQSGKVFEGESERLLVDRKTLVLEGSVSYVHEDQIKIEVLDKEEVKIKKDNRYAYLDADKVRGKLTIRTVQSSDAFQPFGMKGRKLLSDFMTDMKLNLFQKKRQLVVCDEEDIVWVVGLRASEKCRVGEKTKKVVVMTIDEGKD